MTRSLTLALVVIFMTSHWEGVSAHGRLWTPPGRATMWRRGFDTPHNYDDNQMFCGGLKHEQKMGYKCGLCGDPYDSDRPHEAGGQYATGTIAATYVQGQEVVLQVDLTANHRGWFEFKVCETDKSGSATQECLDKNVLQMSDGSGTKLEVADYGSTMINIPVMLPEDLTCDYCMLQWRYHGGNNWGKRESDGHYCIGCGYTSQEEFYGCADIRIIPKGQHSKTDGHHKHQPPTSPPKPETKTDQVTTRKSPLDKLDAKVSPDIFRLTSRIPTAPKAKTEIFTRKIDNSETSSKPVKVTNVDNKEQPTTQRPTPYFIPPHADRPRSIYNEMKSPKVVFECVALLKSPGLTELCYKNCKVGSDNCPKDRCKCTVTFLSP